VLINVAHGFSGSKGKAPKINVKDFLPFPDWEPEAKKNEGPSDSTAKVLVKLLKKRAIPTYVFTSLKSPIVD
jgi:hypothetical protein